MPDRSLGEESKYAYIFGLVKHLETKLITKDRFEKILNSRDADEALKAMAEMGYGAFADDMAGKKDIEMVLAAELRRTYESLLPQVPDREYLDLFFIEYDVHNLKVLLKIWLCPDSAGDEEAFVNAGTLGKKRFADLLGSNPDAVSEAFPDYATDIKKAADRYAEQKDISVIDAVLDAALYRRMGELAGGNELLERLVSMQADMGNMKMAARAKKLGRGREMMHFLPGGTVTETELASLYEKGGEEAFAPFAHRYGNIVPPAVEGHRQTGTWLALEKHIMDAMMGMVRRTSYVMGVEVLAAYLQAKKLEARTLRMIVISKLNGTPADRVRAVWSV